MFVFNPFIAFLDWWTSRITYEEARRRARLSMTGHWKGEVGSNWTPLVVLVVGAVIIEVFRWWNRP
jgi:hypothetical protein